MGGRIYDAHIGRFLQADPFVQAPSNSQNHNRYSYVLNNPLSYTDPSGYFFKSLKKYWKVVVAAVASYYTFGIASAWASGWVGGVIGGAAAGFVGGAIASGSLKGALQGAFSGALFGGIGGALGNAHTAVQVGAHALAGGVISTMQGGKFGHGFFSAGFTKWAGKAWSLETSKDVIGNSLKQAIIGGTASKITGNKFANGAFTAALQYIVNEGSEAIRQSQQESGKGFWGTVKDKLGSLRDLFTGSRGNYDQTFQGASGVYSACTNSPIYQACLAGIDMMEEYIGADNIALGGKAGLALEGAREFTKQGWCSQNAMCDARKLSYGDPNNIKPTFDDPAWVKEQMHRAYGGKPNSEWWKNNE